MALILAIETSGEICSVAIGSENEILSEIQGNSVNQHSKDITLLIHEALNNANLAFDDLDAIAISDGPGSYTGLRVAASCAKALCFAHDIPFIAISTLESLGKEALRQVSQAEYVIPMIDARRMEVYLSVLNDQSEIEVPKAVIINEEVAQSYLNRYGGRLVICGTGASKSKSCFKSSNVICRSDIIPTAKYLLPLAAKAFTKKDFQDVSYYRPFYLKLIDSDISLFYLGIIKRIVYELSFAIGMNQI